MDYDSDAMVYSGAGYRNPATASRPAGFVSRWFKHKKIETFKSNRALFRP